MAVLEIPSRVLGSRITFDVVSVEDAEYVFSLRTNPTYNTHLSAVHGDVDDQRRWIQQYKAREASGTEAYYIIRRADDGRRCGVVRIYGVRDGEFTWGSWILDAHKPHKAALESAYLVYQIGFDTLGAHRAVFDVRLENETTIAFHQRFGATRLYVDEVNAYFEYTRETFAAARLKLRTLIR